jgi:predicted transcriptional regulator
MPHLNIYLSLERSKWLRLELEEIAQRENRSLSYVVEEALVSFIKQQGKNVPSPQRKDRRTHPSR